MIVDRPITNLPEMKQINNITTIEQFVDLGSLITNTGGCGEEIKRRIDIVKYAMTIPTKV